MSTASKVIAVAKAEVGYREGKNNKTKYPPAVKTLEWAQNQPWCATFVSWCAQEAGAKSLYPVTASCDVGGKWFKNRKQWSEYPAVGAQVFFGKSSDLNHTGLVHRYDPDCIWTIEGNAAGNAHSVNGDGVYLKKHARRSSYVVGYGYPAFAEGIVNADPSRQHLMPKPPAATPAAVKAKDARLKAKIIKAKEDIAVWRKRRKALKEK